MKLVHALFLSLALAGCSGSKEDDKSGQPTPRVTQTVTASPTETPTATASPEVTHYRMMTVVAGHPDITFTVALNGNTIGTLNGDSNGDISPSVLPGDNTVVVSWSSAHPLKPMDKATLSIERQIPGQDDWTTVYSRQVDVKTTVKQAKGMFTNEAMGDNSSMPSSSSDGGGGGYNTSGATGTSANGTPANGGTNGSPGGNGGVNSSVPGGMNTGNTSMSPNTGSNQTTNANMTNSGSNSTSLRPGGVNATGNNGSRAGQGVGNVTPPSVSRQPTSGANVSGANSPQIPGRGAAGNTSPITP